MSMTEGYIRGQSPVNVQMVESYTAQPVRSIVRSISPGMNGFTTTTTIVQKRAAMPQEMMATLSHSASQLANLPEASLIGEMQVISQEQINGMLDSQDVIKHNQVHLQAVNLFPNTGFKTTTTKTVTKYLQNMIVKAPTVVIEKQAAVGVTNQAATTTVVTPQPVLPSAVNGLVRSRVSSIRASTPPLSPPIISSNETIAVVAPVRPLSPPIRPVSPISVVQPVASRIIPNIGSNVAMPIPQVKPMTGTITSGLYQPPVAQVSMTVPSVVPTNSYAHQYAAYRGSVQAGYSGALYAGYNKQYPAIYGSNAAGIINFPINIPAQHALVLQNVSPMGQNLNVNVHVSGQMPSPYGLHAISPTIQLAYIQ